MWDSVLDKVISYSWEVFMVLIFQKPPLPGKIIVIFQSIFHSTAGLFTSFLVLTSKVFDLSFQSETHVGWMKTGQAIRLFPRQVLMHAQPRMGNDDLLSQEACLQAPP